MQANHKRYKRPHAPWSYHVGEDYTEFYDAKDNPICQVRYAMDEGTAALVAAAPELFDALDAIMFKARDLLLEHGWKIEVEDAMAAIKKALGD